MTDIVRSHIRHLSRVAALAGVVLKFGREGAEVEIVGLDPASGTIVGRLAVHDKAGALDKPPGH